MFELAAYILSEMGYDCWLGNARGNDYGLKHKTLSVDSKEFWDFSFHELGLYDLPAMFDLMLKVTNTTRGYFFGHSQGGTVFSVWISMRPEYNKKIIQAHLMAPGIFMKNAPPVPEPFKNFVKVSWIKNVGDMFSNVNLFIFSSSQA